MELRPNIVFGVTVLHILVSKQKIKHIGRSYLVYVMTNNIYGSCDRFDENHRSLTLFQLA